MDHTHLEAELADLAEQLTAPQPDECLDCYLDRMLDAHGCTGHRFTRLWARARPRGSQPGLLRWLRQRHGYCDCEVVINSLHEEWSASRRDGMLCASALARREAERQDDVEPDPDDPPRPAPPVGCSGVG